MIVLPLLWARAGLPLLGACLSLVVTLVLEGISVPALGVAVPVYASPVLLGWYGSLSYLCLDYQILLAILVIVAVEYLLGYTQFVLNIIPVSGTGALPPSQPSGLW